MPCHYGCTMPCKMATTTDCEMTLKCCHDSPSDCTYRDSNRVMLQYKFQPLVMANQPPPSKKKGFYTQMLWHDCTFTLIIIR